MLSKAKAWKGISHPNKAHILRRVLLVALILALGGLQRTMSQTLKDPRPVTLVTADSVHLSALYRPAHSVGTLRPGLIMLHGSNRTKERWEVTGFINHLSPEDYHFLYIDIRGRGDSEAGQAEALKMNPFLAIEDIEAAMVWLKQQPGVDTTRIALVGSSYGANLIATGMLTRGCQDIGAVLGYSRHVSVSSIQPGSAYPVVRAVSRSHTRGGSLSGTRDCLSVE